MRTPVTPEAINQRTVTPEIQKGEFDTKVPEGAFGGISESNVQDIGKNVDLATKVEDQAEKIGNGIVVDAANTGMQNDLTKLIGSAQSAKGQDVGQFAPFVNGSATQKAYGEISQKYLGMAKNDEQKAQIQDKLNKLIVETNKTLDPIVIKGNFQFATETALEDTKAAISRASAVYNAPDDVRESARQAVIDSADKQTSLHGYPLTNADGTVSNLAKMNRETATTTFDGMVIAHFKDDNQPQKAMDYAKQHLSEAKIANQMPALQKAVDEKNVTDLYDTKLKRMVDTEGKPNVSAMVAQIPKDLTPEQHETYEKKIVALAGQQNAVNTDRKLNAQNNFWNTIAKMRQAKAPLDDQLNTADRMGLTPLQKEVFRKYVTAPYTDKNGLTINIGGQNEARKADLNLNMMTNISQGRLTDPVVIDRLYANGTLDSKEHVAAIKLLNQVNKGGKNAEIAMTRDQIQSNAMQVYDDPVKVHAFMQGLDKASTSGHWTEIKQLTAYAKENLEPESKNPSTFWDKITGNKNAQYQDEVAENDPDLIKSLYNDLGREQVSAIFGYLNRGKPTPSGTSIKDFDENFIQKLGVPLSDLERGKPMNNAMQSIIQWNNNHPTQQIDFSPEMIKHFASKVPDGYFH